MHPAAGDRGDIDDAALRRRQLLDQAARQRHGREEVDVEHLLPEVERRVDGAQPLAFGPLGEIAALLTSASQPCRRQRARISRCRGRARPDRRGRAARGSAAARPRAERAERLARDGDDAPAAAPNFFTVAWPMPRLAPVSTRVRVLP
jgi:hypothetical protein